MWRVDCGHLMRRESFIESLPVAVCLFVRLSVLFEGLFAGMFVCVLVCLAVLNV